MTAASAFSARQHGGRRTASGCTEIARDRMAGAPEGMISAGARPMSRISCLDKGDKALVGNSA